MITRRRPLAVTVAIAVIATLARLAAQDAQVVYSPGKGITNPVLIKKVDAAYTEQSKAQLLRGEVWLDAIVDLNGTVKVLRVTKSLDDQRFGLDTAAVDAASDWLFTPGKKDGVAVPVRVTLIVEFRNPELGTRSRVVPSAEPADDFAKGTVNPGDPFAVAPVPLRAVKPAYTAEARRAHIQGMVLVEAIVREDGRVADVRIIRSLDKTFGLDDKALAAARQFVFTGGTYHGQPASFDMMLRIEFKIR